MNIKLKEQSLELMREACVKNDLKITPQRTFIYRTLIHSKEHPTAEAIFTEVKKTLPNISFDTVYRTLLTFSEIGLIHTVEGTGTARRFDPDLESHHHCRCIKCDRIIDFQDRKLDAVCLPSAIGNDFKVLTRKVVFEGICKKCAKE